jgi:hypothetical protein
MKLKVYLTIVIRIILMTAIGMIMSYIPEHLRGFFGDVPNGTDLSMVDKGWDWGTRHH